MPEHTIAEDDAGFAVVAAQMLWSSPAAIGKLGTIELDLVCFCCAGQTPVPQMLYILSRNAGMFPATNEVAQEMAARLVQALADMTCLSPWVHLENTWAVFDRYASPKTEYVGLSALECYLSPDRARWWTARLPPHTKVLVISPFAQSIEKQLPKLQDVFPGLWRHDTQFQTLAFPLSYGVQDAATQADMRQRWTNSIGLLEDMQRQMDACEYDIVLVGAGIYSLPLVAHAKRRGKKGIHLGGATQLFFGIRGARWDAMPAFQRFFNEHWIRPTERPPLLELVEGGCYW